MLYNFSLKMQVSLHKMRSVGRELSYLVTVFKYSKGTWQPSQTNANQLPFIFNTLIISLRMNQFVGRSNYTLYILIFH